MKFTVSQLRQIIREEASRVRRDRALREAWDSEDEDPNEWWKWVPWELKVRIMKREKQADRKKLEKSHAELAAAHAARPSNKKPGLVLVNGKLRAQTDPEELRKYEAREATPEEVRELDAALREPRPAGVSARKWNREIDDRFMAWQVWGPWDGVVQPSYVSRASLK